MKKLFTILVLSVLTLSTSFAGVKCVFITANQTPDDVIINHLKDNGYDVDVFIANGTVPVAAEGSYALAVLSETIGSTATTWKAFTNAPLPFVALKTFAARGHNSALKWLTTNSTGVDYANTTDITVTIADDTHPIMADFTGTPQLLYGTVVDPLNAANIYALQWLKFPTLPTGAKVLTTATIGTGTIYTVEGPLPQTIAFDRGTVINLSTLANRAVISGINFGANAQLTPAGLKLIKQACDWVAAGGVATAVQPVVANSILKKSGSELINPTGLKVEVYTILGAHIFSTSDLSINVEKLAKGVYVAKTSAGFLKFSL